MEIFDFGKGIPSCIVAEGGNLSIERSIKKQGTGSLRWDFNSGDSLVINGDVGYKKMVLDGTDFRVYTFGVYLFGFSNGDKLHVAFCKNEKEMAGLDINLGFSGWRSITACFERDMTGEPTENMNRTVFTAKSSGSLLFSELVLANRVDARHVLKSYQVPQIANEEVVIKPNRKLKPIYQDVRVDLKSVATIKERLLSYICTEFAKTKIQLSEIQKRVDELDIQETEFGITGKRAEWINQRAIVGDTPWFQEEYVNVRTVTDLMLDIAAYYTKTKDKEVLKLYMTVLKYLIVQGFAEGSSFGTHKILDYGLRPVYFSVFLMQSEIEKVGLSDFLVKTMLWFLHITNLGLDEEIPMTLASCDDFFNIARGVLVTILMMKDAQKQASYLKAFSDWVSNSLCCRPGLQGMLKSDGCIYHHHGHYISYGNGALEGVTPIIYALSGTEFEIDKPAYVDLYKVISSLHFQCCGVDVPVAFSGRDATGTRSISTAIFKYFALAALENNDAYPAGLYKSIKKVPEDEFDKKIFDAVSLDEFETNDNRSFPMACACVHKREKFMAVAKGFSKYLWGSEIYQGANMYGRYRSFGTLELINGKNPFSHDGYDWNRFPGTTSVHLPFEKLRANILNVDSKSGFEEMLLSDRSFVGAVSMDKNGMFAMELSEHPKYGVALKAKKSIFFFDDFIVALGTDIENEAEYETETTLFQISAQVTEGVSLLNGKTYNGEYTVKKGDVLTDSFGNNYYIREGTDILCKNGKQTSPSSLNDSETSGEFSSAVIRHGVKPLGESYEYAIGVNGAECLDYEILCADSKAHIVKIKNITYGAIFVPGTYSGISANEPILFMLSQSGEELKTAVCNPDLGLYEEDKSQCDEKGKQKEVSIYSRTWLNNRVGKKNIVLDIEKYNVSVSVEAIGGSIYTAKFKERGERL